MFRGSEWLRLGSMLAMLTVVFLLMTRLRDPDTVRAIDALWNPGSEVLDVPQPAPVQAPPAQAAEPEPSGPTDEDPEQIEEIRNEFQVITDRTETIQREEMVPYNRIVQWVYNQTASQMRRRARTDLEFNDFLQSPDKHRGQLVELVLHAKLIRQCAGPPEYPSPLYEVWGPTSQSGSWFYAAIAVNLPEGMPLGRYVDERVRIVGYFFKVQGYQPPLAKPGDRSLPAPLVIGRMIWIKPQLEAAEAPDWFGRWTQGVPGWLLWGGLLAVVAVTVAVAWMAGRGRRPGLRKIAATSGPPPILPELGPDGGANSSAAEAGGTGATYDPIDPDAVPPTEAERDGQRP